MLLWISKSCFYGYQNTNDAKQANHVWQDSLCSACRRASLLCSINFIRTLWGINITWAPAWQESISEWSKIRLQIHGGRDVERGPLGMGTCPGLAKPHGPRNPEREGGESALLTASEPTSAPVGEGTGALRLGKTSASALGCHQAPLSEKQ
jgi:hypothetical protein